MKKTKKAQMGSTLPGMTGNMYARVGAPSNGKRAKKTLPSAQSGYEILEPTEKVQREIPIIPNDFTGFLDKKPKPAPKSAYTKLEEIYLPKQTEYLNAMEKEHGYSYQGDNALKLKTGKFNRASVPKKLIEEAYGAAEQEGLDPYLLFGMIGQESTFGGALDSTGKVKSKRNLVSGWNLGERYNPSHPLKFLADRKAPGVQAERTFHGYEYNVTDEKAMEEYLAKNPKLRQQYIRDIQSKTVPKDYDQFREAAKWIKNKGFKSYNPGDEKYEDSVMNSMNLLKSDPVFSGYVEQIKNKKNTVRPDPVKLDNNFQQGGPIEDNRGQWAHPGKVTKINSNNITMKGVPYPVLGVSDTGHKQMMQPNQDYSFDGSSVTEYPMTRQDKGQLKKLKQLTEFKKGGKIKKAQIGAAFDYVSNVKPQGQAFQAATGVAGPLSSIGGIGGAINIGQDLIKGGQMLKQEKEAKGQAEQFAALSGVVNQAASIRPEGPRRKYVRPEDMITDPNDLSPSYGTGTNFLQAQDGAIVPHLSVKAAKQNVDYKKKQAVIEKQKEKEALAQRSKRPPLKNPDGSLTEFGKMRKKLEKGGEIQNTYAPKTLYDGLEEIPQAQFGAQAGSVGSWAGSKLFGGTGEQSGAGQIGTTIGKTVGNIILPGIGGTILGGIGGFLGGAFGAKNQKKTANWQEEGEQNMANAAFQQGSQNIHNQYSSFMEHGGNTNPQVIKYFGNNTLNSLLKPDPTMDTLRSGGHLKEDYVQPTERALQTGGKVKQDATNMSPLFPKIPYKTMKPYKAPDRETLGGNRAKDMLYLKKPGDDVWTINPKTYYDDVTDQWNATVNSGLYFGRNPMNEESVKNRYETEMGVSRFASWNKNIPEDQMVNEWRKEGISKQNNGGQTYAMGGSLKTHWGGRAEPISYNPYLPGDGESIEFQGQSHDNGGIGVTFGKSKVEVEGGEPAVKLQSGGDMESLVVFGDMKIPSYGVSEIGDQKAKGKKFKTYVKDLNDQESKVNKSVDKGVKYVNESNESDPFESLTMNTGKAMMLGGDMKLKDIAKKKQMTSIVQNAILETAKEHGLKSSELAQGKFKRDTKAIKNAQLGGIFEKDSELMQWIRDLQTMPGKKVQNPDKGVDEATDELIKRLPGVVQPQKPRLGKQYPLLPEVIQSEPMTDVSGRNTEGYVPASENQAMMEVNPDKITGEGNFGQYWHNSQNSGQGPVKSIVTPRKIGGNPKKHISPPQDQMRIIDAPEGIPYSPISMGNIGPGTAVELQNYVNNTKGNPSNTSQGKSKGNTDWMDVVGAYLPYLRPSNQMKLDPNQLMGEMFGLSSNNMEAVQAQKYNPLLEQATDYSFQDQLNANQADFNAIKRQVGNNPAALASLAGQKYAANSSVLANQFRTNQEQKQGVYNRNRGVLNDATIKNLGIMDQQYVRQSQAKSNTKAVAQAALNSISDKIAKNKLENKTLGIYENMYNYRFGPQGRAQNWNGPAQWNTEGNFQQLDEQGNVVETQKTVDRDALYRVKNQRERTTSKKTANGGIVKSMK